MRRIHSVARTAIRCSPVGAAVVYMVVLFYVLKSGVLGVGWTNTFQGIFMMILAWGLGCPRLDRWTWDLTDI